jgi:hypothetical protein
MGHVLLAAKITLYVGGLIVFYENPKQNTLDLLLLRDSSLVYSHNGPIEKHQPHLTVPARSLVYTKDASMGYEMSGGGDAEQLARFPLSGLITLNTVKGKIDLGSSHVPQIGKGSGRCEKDLYAYIENQHWPIIGRIRLQNGIVTPASDYLNDATFMEECPKDQKDLVTIAERVQIVVTLDDSDAVFEWADGDAKATIKVNELTSVGVWNIPEKPHMLSDVAHDFLAYYSVLKDRGACLSRPRRCTNRGSQPIFCPPSRVTAEQ